ncbi:unnamed protein product, partial [Pleuronectes platessa]
KDLRALVGLTEVPPPCKGVRIGFGSVGDLRCERPEGTLPLAQQQQQSRAVLLQLDRRARGKRRRRRRRKRKRTRDDVSLLPWALDNRTERERQREYKMGLAVGEGVRGMESRVEAEREEEDHRKEGRVMGGGEEGGGESDVWRVREKGSEEGWEEEEERRRRREGKDGYGRKGEGREREKCSSKC